MNITFPNVPLPASPLIGADPLGQQSLTASNLPDPELSKDEEAALKEHLAELGMFAEAVTQAKAVEGAPIYGDVAAMSLPIPRNDAPGGLMPLETDDAWIARGYMDLDGKITKAGEYYFDLEDSGLFDEKGQLTEKGAAFALDPKEALSPGNLNGYIVRDKYGLNDKPDRPFMDIAGDVGGFVWDAVKGSAKLGRNLTIPGLVSMFGDAEAEAENIIAGQAFAEGAVESPMILASGLEAIRDKSMAALTGNDLAYYAAKQKHEAIKTALGDADIADLAAVVGVSEEMVSDIEQNREMARMVLGDQRADAIRREGEAAGSLVGDPSNLISGGIGAAVGKGLQFPTISRNVERATQAALASEDAAAALAKAQSVADKTARAAGMAAKQAENLRNTGLNPARMEELAGRMAGTHMEAAESIPALELKAKAASAYAQTMVKQAGGADKVAAAVEAAAEVGRKVRATPARAIAPVIEGIGEKMIAVDNAIWGGLEKLGATQQTIAGVRGGLAALGVSTGGLAAPFAALAAGPVVRGVGNFTRVLGQELMQARGTTPFWQRVAQSSAISPVGRATAHAIDNATLSGKAFAPVRLAGTGLKGAAAAAPVDLAFEIVAEGGDLSPSTLKQGLAEALVFGGPSSMGGALVKGDLNTLRAKAAGDEINLRKRLDAESLAGFSRMNHGLRRNLSIYAGSFPTLDFKFTEDGPNSYDRTTNTILVNRNSPDPLRGIVAHEVNHYLQVQSQAEEGIRAMLVGDGVNGGLLRSADGTLDPNFKAAMDAYNGRLPETARLSPEEFAVEYFNEATVDNLLQMTESGDLQRAAGRSDLERMIRGIAEKVIPKLPILQNIFFNTGGALDSKGGMVQGNGLLASGVREIPGAKAMLRKMADEQAGRGPEKVMGPKDEKVTIPAAALKNNRPLQEAFFGTLKTDDEGNVLIGEDGFAETIDKATDEVRSRAGLSIIEDQTKKIKEGKPLAEGEIAPKENGNFEGTHVPDKAIDKLKGTFNGKQRKAWKILNESSKNWDGATFNVIYQPALKTTKKGKKIYEGLPATFREVVPVGVSTTSKGNILIHFFSVTQFVDNIRKRAKTALGKELYKGNENAIREDAEAVMALHRQGKTTDAYFAQKYGEIEGGKRKNFINTVFGLMTEEQRTINPLFEAEKVKNEGVYRTYRLDRINQTTRLQGRTPLPFSYTSVKANLFPGGEPEMSETP